MPGPGNPNTLGSVVTAAFRNAGTLHRNARTAPDKLSTPTVGVATAVTEAGSTLPNSLLNYTVAAGNRWGPTLPAAIQNITPSLNQAVRFSISQASTDSSTYYDIFLSTAAAPLWVGRITEAQRAAGGFIISSVGVVTAGGGAPAGSIDIGIQGTGVASNSAPFIANNAYTPTALQGGDQGISCAGYSRAHCHIKVAVTDLRIAPTLTIVPFFQDQLSPTDLFQGLLQTVSLLTGVGQSLEQDFEIDIDGATNFEVLIDSITGNGAACTIWVELA